MHIGRRRSLPAPGGPLRCPISLISCTWDAHRPLPRVSTGAHPHRMRCGIRWDRGPLHPVGFLDGAHWRRLSAGAAAKGSGPCVVPSPPVLIREPGPAWIPPSAGTSMRGRHAVKPRWTGRGRRPAGTVRRSGCETLRLVPPRFSRTACNVPNPLTTHPPSADPRPDCTASTGDCASPTWGRIGKNSC